MYTSVNLVLQLERRKKNNMSRLLSEESYQVWTVILQGANMGKLIDPEFRRCRDALKSKQKKELKKKAEEISRMQLLLSQKRKLRTIKLSTIATEHCVAE